MSRMVAMEALNRGPAPADRDLWRALREPDEAAFRALFIRHSTAVYNYCFRRTASWSGAEDAVQATFATLWRRAAAGGGGQGGRPPAGIGPSDPAGDGAQRVRQRQPNA
jgi:hypothetical protein